MDKSAILCVDDELFVLESLEIQLQKAFGGTYQYEFAESADEAIEVIKELHGNHVNIIVIVSDWLMPGIKGDEFLIHIHQQFPKSIKILLTGQADEIAIKRVEKQANLHACLPKPWKSEELIAIIQSSLSNL